MSFGSVTLNWSSPKERYESIEERKKAGVAAGFRLVRCRFWRRASA